VVVTGSDSPDAEAYLAHHADYRRSKFIETGVGVKPDPRAAANDARGIVVLVADQRQNRSGRKRSSRLLAHCVVHGQSLFS
jgi:hypothetical protein